MDGSQAVLGELGEEASLARALLEGLPDATVVVFDRELRVLRTSGSAYARHGLDPRDVVGRLASEIVPAGGWERVKPHYDAMLAGEARSFDYATVDGRASYWMRLTPVMDAGGGVIGGIMVSQDVSDRRRTEAELRQRLAQQSAVAELGRLALEGIPLDELMDRAVRSVAAELDVELATVLELLPGGERFLVRSLFGNAEGLEAFETTPSSEETLAGYVLRSSVPVVSEDLPNETRFRASHLIECGMVSATAVTIGERERPFGVLGAHTSRRRHFTYHDRAYLEAVANVIADAVERRRAEERIRHQALHDPLTGLPNRTLLLDRLEHALAVSAREGTQVAVVFLDLDGFKDVNDSQGHHAGDELLRGVADRLRRATRANDTVARFGGDEFVLVAESLPGEAQVGELAERLRAALAPPFDMPYGEERVCACMGLVVAGSRGADAGRLVREADAAMYRAKQRGPGSVEIKPAAADG